ncbi:hypothetical protein [Cypionkella sinensis]|uniref:Uncharacterized protein n=1 Tax=Cypionkella sinensis TaxID=1756043 RepID=A0ABV7J5X2_9RHOB
MLKALLSAVVICAAIPAQAGIDFAHMPVGCSWSMKYSDGRTLIETYVGKKSGSYRTEVADKRAPDKVISRTYFDKKGRMVRNDWAGGKWETFNPYSCFGIAGTCSSTYQNGDGAKFIIDNTTSAAGNGFKVVAAPRGGAPYPDDYFELGQFNIQTLSKNRNFSMKLVAFNNCDEPLM